MNFARWETKENMEKLVPLIPVNKDSKISKTGLPTFYDDEHLYITDRLNHTLVIGTTGSGKTQVITLPILELSMRSGESIIVHDTRSEIYDRTNEKFKNCGYNIIRLNLDDARDCNKWNPLELPYRLYKEGNKDKAQELIEEIGFYLLNDLNENNQDPFWINSAINYFTGICLYQFEKDGLSSLKEIADLDLYIRENKNDFTKGLDKKSNIYLNLRGVLEAPIETCGSILSVFSQKIKRYISRENLMNALSTTDFDIASLSKEKTIIYVVSGNSNNSEQLLPLFISQVYYAKDEYARNEGKINILIDEFYALYPIKNFAKMLNYARGMNINFVLMIRGFSDLKNIYGKEDTEIIKICFANIVYLLSQDMETLEEISNLCGKTCEDGIIRPLISVEELKTLRPFEAVILMIRMMPFKTKMLPYFQMKL